MRTFECASSLYIKLGEHTVIYFRIQCTKIQLISISLLTLSRKTSIFSKFLKFLFICLFFCLKICISRTQAQHILCKCSDSFRFCLFRLIFKWIQFVSSHQYPDNTPDCLLLFVFKIKE